MPIPPHQVSAVIRIIISGGLFGGDCWAFYGRFRYLRDGSRGFELVLFPTDVFNEACFPVYRKTVHVRNFGEDQVSSHNYKRALEVE